MYELNVDKSNCLTDPVDNLCRSDLIVVVAVFVVVMIQQHSQYKYKNKHESDFDSDSKYLHNQIIHTHNAIHFVPVM